MLATLALGSLALLSLFVDASAEPKDEVAAATSTWARALGEDDPDKVLPLYADDAVLWGTLSPTVRSDRSTVRDYFVAAFKVLPGLKVALLHVEVAAATSSFGSADAVRHCCSKPAKPPSEA
jgi:hypothetical protein